MGPVRPFHRTMEFGGARRQPTQAKALVLTRLLKGRGEFPAAVDVHGPDGHGPPPRERGEELGGRHPGGAAIGLDDSPTGDAIAGGKRFEEDARQRPHLERIDLTAIARVEGGLVTGVAHRIGPGGGPATSGEGSPGWLHELPGRAPPREHPITGLTGAREAFAAQEDRPRLSPPTGILLPEVTEPRHDWRGRRAGDSRVVRSVGPYRPRHRYKGARERPKTWVAKRQSPVACQTVKACKRARATGDRSET